MSATDLGFVLGLYSVGVIVCLLIGPRRGLIDPKQPEDLRLMHKLIWLLVITPFWPVWCIVLLLVIIGQGISHAVKKGWT